MRWTRILPLLLAISPAFAGYTYYFGDTFSSINTTSWQPNGTVSGGSNGLTGLGSVISKLTVQGPSTTNYEVKTTLNLLPSNTNGGVYETYLRATTNADINGTVTGTFYAVQLTPTYSGSTCSATLVIYRTINGAPQSVVNQPAPCNNQMTLRAIALGPFIIVYINNRILTSYLDSAPITTGQPGVGVLNTPTGNGIARVDLGPYDNVAPGALTTQTLGTSVFPTRVDMQWQAVLDDPNGTGIAYYEVFRNGALIGETTVPIYQDSAVAASTPYTYTIYAVDFHWNSSNMAFNITTPPAGAIEAREIGVRPTGAYWGGTGEQIDMRSMNLNFTVPLVKAVGRGSWGVGFNLMYNSQNWRQDPGGTWNLGRDVGYGYGWQLQVGSLTPVYAGYYTFDHWVFTDSTGAEYKLNNLGANGVWTSSESVFVWFDTNTNRLYFRDGSFWVFSCISGGSEQDAGTFYPTMMEDTNGNQVAVTYYPGDGLTALNTSARIRTIEDVRGNGINNYSFTYNAGTPPHLASITNTIGTAENYTFTIATAQPLKDPFSQASFGTTASMQSLTQTGTSLVTSFGYGANNSAELTSVTFPYKAILSWVYQPFTYVGSRTQREIQNRYLVMSQGNTQFTYAMSQHDSGDVNRNVHYYTVLDDPDGQSEKVWYFQTDTSQSNVGLLLTHQKRLHPGVTAGAMEDDYTWAADAAGDLYIGTDVTTADLGLSTQIQKTTTQTLDPGANGNVTQTTVSDWGNATPTRTYSSTYLTNNQNYTARWMFNRLVQTKVTTDGVHFTTLVQNTYDGSSLTDRPGIYEHDSTYNTSFQYRGNVTSTTSPGVSTTITYDIGGAVVASTTNGVTNNVSTTSATNFAAPSQLTTATSSSSMNYSSFLGMTSQTGQNGDSGSVIYDATARPSTSTSPYGAQTTYNYYDTAVPPYKQATTNGHWVKTFIDGFGRTITTQTGNGATVVSYVDTNYAPSGGSPLGRVNAASQPYAVLANRVWTFNYYDGLGRTTSTVAPDGPPASNTTYLYAGNTVKVTDPSGKWKLYTSDAFGSLTQVQEPDPSLSTVTTSYTYDMLNHLTNVSMPRGTTTQQRSFNYIDPSTNAPGALLRSATNPENGTVSYTYNGNNLLSTKTDAKSHVLTYTYDTYNRLYQVLSGSTVLRTYYYDTNTLDTSHTFTQYGTGRLVAVQYGASPAGTMAEWYSYTQPGQAATKRLQITGANLDASYTYDNEGKTATVQYPNGGPKYTYAFDTMHRPTTLTDQNNNQVVSAVAYSPANQIQSIDYFSVLEQRTYNNLLQTTVIGISQSGTALFNVGYNYTAGANNGKISSQYDYLTGETVNYTYDSLNRLITAQAGSTWGDSYSYDAFGNLSAKTPTAGSAPSMSVTVNTATNQVGGVDANGNNTVGAWDVENRLVAVSNVQYAYDGANQRVWKGTYSGSTLVSQEAHFYGVEGKELAVYSLNGSGGATQTSTKVYFAGKMVGVNGNAFVADRLGSLRSSSGQAVSFYPYGEDKGTPAANDQVKFATYTRDSVDLFDYANQRYYYSGWGRFLSPDPYRASAGPSDPQSWNRYSYAGNDPTNRIDPSGRDFCDPDDPFCISLDIPDFSSFCSIQMPPGYSGPALRTQCFLLPIVIGILEQLQSHPILRAPTSIEILFDVQTQSIEDCYVSVQGSGGTLAERDVNYGVYDQFGYFMSGVRVREILVMNAKGEVCPTATTKEGNTCIGQWKNGGGFFLDSLAIKPFYNFEEFTQSFEVQTLPNQSGYASVADGKLFINGNYTDVGSPTNDLKLYPNKIGINDNFGYGPDGKPRRCSAATWAPPF